MSDSNYASVDRQALTASTFVELIDTLVDDFDVIDLLTVLASRCVELLDVAAAGILLADASGHLRVMAASTEQIALLELFLRHPGQVLSREQILSHVWGYDFDPGSNVVDVYVRALRRKLGAEQISTVRGMGYAVGR